MSKSLNKAILIGNVGSDPEIRSTNNGGRVANFSIATSRNWTDPSGQKQEKTQWHRVVVWNRGRTGLADVVEKYVKKGERVYVEGEIEYRQWQDRDGQTRYSTEINVSDLLLLGGRSGGGGDEGGPRRSAAPAGAGRAASGDGGAGSDDFADFPGALQDEDDDLPF